MKLRIKGNSIRLRLLRSEVERFAIERRISDEVRFGANAFRYSLRMSSEVDSIHAHFDANEITVLVSEPAARKWAESDDVGLETQQAIGDSETLTVIIEKDFVCVDRPDDPDRDDAFPNPQLTCGQAS